MYLLLSLDFMTTVTRVAARPARPRAPLLLRVPALRRRRRADADVGGGSKNTETGSCRRLTEAPTD